MSVHYFLGAVDLAIVRVKNTFLFLGEKLYGAERTLEERAEARVPGLPISPLCPSADTVLTMFENGLPIAKQYLIQLDPEGCDGPTKRIIDIQKSDQNYRFPPAGVVRVNGLPRGSAHVLIVHHVD